LKPLLEKILTTKLNQPSVTQNLLDGVEGYDVVGDFGDCSSARQVVEDLLPDIVIMDIDMPKVNGIEGLRIIKEARPGTAIIMHTVFEDEERLFDSLCAGANGYLLKNSSFVKLLEALDEVQQGGAPMSPSVARKVLRSFQRHSLVTNKYDLSPREVELLQLLVKGYSYKMIASSLFISLATVQSHIRNIYSKLHVNCGREAVVIALREQIV
jgi:DNA-binding NarL/FixJ family response regulator